MKCFRLASLCIAILGNLALSAAPVAAEEGKAFIIGKKYELTAPAGWIVKQPKINFIEFEFEVPVAEGDEIPGRVTVMGASGGVESNIERWKGQFKMPDDSEVKPDIKQFEAAGQQVHVVDIKGTYKDSVGGPFAGGKITERPDYRMLGAIITTKEEGQYFVKFYGPVKTVTSSEVGFKKMIEGLQETK